MSELRRAAREVRQRLEVDRLFGWAVPVRRLPARTPTPPPTGAPPAAGSRGPGPGAPVRAPRPHPPAGAGAAPPRPTVPAPRTDLPPLPAGRVDPGEVERVLEAMREEVAACARCPLADCRSRTVFGAGDPRARLLFVGEAPGYDEDRVGEPFVGKAGQLLNDIIRAMGLRREDVYIANVIKCRPPQNRKPEEAEVAACRGFLERQIELIRPEAIVGLGTVAGSFLLGRPVTLAAVRARFHEYRGVPVMVTYHPAYLLRYPEEKRKVWHDVQLVMARLGLERPR